MTMDRALKLLAIAIASIALTLSTGCGSSSEADPKDPATDGDTLVATQLAETQPAETQRVAAQPTMATLAEAAVEQRPRLLKPSSARRSSSA